MAADADLLKSFAREARGRTEAIVEAMRSVEDGSSPALDTLESLRREAHTLKGTAAILDLARLSELAGSMEAAIRAAAAAREIEPDVATWLERAAIAFREGVEAAADSDPEPAAVGEAIAHAPEAEGA
jgi:chemotaxis protein histidine kinase CheA